MGAQAADVADRRAPAQRIAAKPRPAKAKRIARADATEKTRCPSDRIVWVDAKAGVYDLPSAPGYGKTTPGEYMCEMDAKAAGDEPTGSKKDQ